MLPGVCHQCLMRTDKSKEVTYVLDVTKKNKKTLYPHSFQCNLEKGKFRLVVLWEGEEMCLAIVIV